MLPQLGLARTLLLTGALEGLAGWLLLVRSREVPGAAAANALLLAGAVASRASTPVTRGVMADSIWVREGGRARDADLE